MHNTNFLSCLLQLANQERIIDNLRTEQSSILVELKESKGRSGKFDAEMNELRANNYRLTVSSSSTLFGASVNPRHFTLPGAREKL